MNLRRRSNVMMKVACCWDASLRVHKSRVLKSVYRGNERCFSRAGKASATGSGTQTAASASHTGTLISVGTSPASSSSQGRQAKKLERAATCKTKLPLPHLSTCSTQGSRRTQSTSTARMDRGRPTDNGNGIVGETKLSDGAALDDSSRKTVDVSTNAAGQSVDVSSSKCSSHVVASSSSGATAISTRSSDVRDHDPGDKTALLETTLEDLRFLRSLMRRAPDLFQDQEQVQEIERAWTKMSESSSTESPSSVQDSNAPEKVSSTSQNRTPSEETTSTRKSNISTSNYIVKNEDEADEDGVSTKIRDSICSEDSQGSASSSSTPGVTEDEAPDPAFLDELSDKVLERDRQLLPTIAQYARKHRWMLTTRALLEERCGGKLYAFGSCQNGFWQRGSDVDACLAVPGCNVKDAQVSKLRLVGALLRAAKAGRVQVVPAKVPVAKVFNTDGSEAGDISINNTVAIDNSNFVRSLSMFDPRVRHVGRVIKHWAKLRKINERAEGTLSTYTLILQLFYIMQSRFRVLPLFRDLVSPVAMADGSPKAQPRRANGDPIIAFRSRAEILALREDTRSTNATDDTAHQRGVEVDEVYDQQTSIGELFYDFFMYFGSEELSRGRTIVDGVVEENDEGVLIMRCPLTKANVNPMSADVWRAIWEEFARARSLLQSQNFAEIFEPADACPLRRMRKQANKSKNAVIRRNKTDPSRVVGKENSSNVAASTPSPEGVSNSSVENSTSSSPSAVGDDSNELPPETPSQKAPPVPPTVNTTSVKPAPAVVSAA
ncbi:unnamed protein product [Amoebophrya sp. A25]|nr:unnamed protein product [Amoebophrya sp. A25]|eukprot:GSA25T00011742001.1